MSCEYKVIAYHANDKSRCAPFIDKGRPIIDSRDKFWLGRGMYFWDNRSNAQYWASQKIKKGSSIVWLIQADICTDYLFDLKDKRMRDEFEKLWQVFSKKQKLQKTYPLGMKIDILYDAYLSDKFDVFRCEGLYKSKPEYFLRHEKFPYPTSQTKTIYNVKKKFDRISNRKKVEEITQPVY